MKLLKRRNVILTGLLICGAAAGTAFYQSRQPHFRKIEEYKSAVTEVHIVGEVVDAWCYASQTMGPGRGPAHIACATACIAGGVTPGILEDQTKILYVAAKGKGFEGCKDLLLPFIGKKVIVDGWLGELGGSRILKVGTVRAVGAKAAGVKSLDQEPVEGKPETKEPVDGKAENKVPLEGKPEPKEPLGGKPENKVPVDGKPR